MSFFNIDFKRLALTVFILACPLVLLNLESPSRNLTGLGPVDFLAGVSQTGLQRLGEGVQSTVSHYLLLLSVKEEANEIKENNDRLQARLLLLNELRMENERLRKLLDFSEAHEMNLMAARVVGQDLFQNQATVRIDRGTLHGVEEQMAVMTTEGVVGYIFRPQLMSSQVLLLTDGYAVVDALVQRTRARGIVEGRAGKTCQLRYLERVEDVAVGDLVVTSGLFNIFPKGLPVATVKAVESYHSGISIRVDLEPIIDPDRLEEVFVIFDASDADLTESYKEP